MTVYLVRRILQALLVVLAMSLIVFIGVYAIGDPVEILISPDADQIERERAVQALGLDLPLWQQYAVFLTKALQGDLGRSFVYNEPALKLILQRMPATLELAFGATIIALIIGLPLGLYAGLRPDGRFSRVIMAGSILGFSLPTFWVGLMLIMVFAVYLGWLPSTGRGDTGTLLGLHWSFLTSCNTGKGGLFKASSRGNLGKRMTLGFWRCPPTTLCITGLIRSISSTTRRVL